MGLQKVMPVQPATHVMQYGGMSLTLRLRKPPEDAQRANGDNKHHSAPMATTMAKCLPKAPPASYVNKKKEAKFVHTNEVGVQMKGVPMRIVVMTGGTFDAKRITLDDCCLTDTVNDVKSMIQDVEGTPADQIRLVFKGEELWSGCWSLSRFNIQKDSILLMLPSRSELLPAKPWVCSYMSSVHLDCTATLLSGLAAASGQRL
jgi:hypothetical protein